MASICQRCSLRLQRVAQAEVRHLSKRPFSSTTARSKSGLPTFNESSSQELDDVLLTLREKHFIPAYLGVHERNRMFKQKYRQSLQDNPQTVFIGEEEVSLQWIDRMKDIPPREQLVRRALDLITEGETSDWHNLPKLLHALNVGLKKPALPHLQVKIVRRALETGRFGLIMQLLQSADKTGMTLKHPEVLLSVLVGVRDTAQSSEWSQESTERALSYVRILTELLETEEHCAYLKGQKSNPLDPRSNPAVLGVFLELAAVYAYKFKDAQDGSGLVGTYARRLLHNLDRQRQDPRVTELISDKHNRRLFDISVLHGLTLSREILGEGMPSPDLAKETVDRSKSRLAKSIGALQTKAPTVGTLEHQALTAWNTRVLE